MRQSLVFTVSSFNGEDTAVEYDTHLEVCRKPDRQDAFADRIWDIKPTELRTREAHQGDKNDPNRDVGAPRPRST